MENLKISEKDGKATLTFDVGKRLRASGSGKTVLVALTGKAVQIDGTEVFVNVTAYAYPPKAFKGRTQEYLDSLG